MCWSHRLDGLPTSSPLDPIELFSRPNSDRTSSMSPPTTPAPTPPHPSSSRQRQVAVHQTLKVLPSCLACEQLLSLQEDSSLIRAKRLEDCFSACLVNAPREDFFLKEREERELTVRSSVCGRDGGHTPALNSGHCPRAALPGQTNRGSAKQSNRWRWTLEEAEWLKPAFLRDRKW